MRHLVLVAVCLAACHSNGATPAPDAPDGDGPAAPDASTVCPAGLAGAACVLDLWDQAQGCDPALVATLRSELDARAKLGPLWAGGRALFRTAAVTHVAGGWNSWDPQAFATAPVCGTDLVAGVTDVASGFWPYKLVEADVWSLDPANPAFAYDDFAGNPDRRNSVLDTPDSGRGHLVKLERACSTALDNCRDVTAYVPPGYDATDHMYPVLFMHDGQNVWDDQSCCFGHGGWQMNVALDTEIAAGNVAPIIVIGADNTIARSDEYGLNRTTMDTFIAFQINELQPQALAQVRGDGKRVFVAGSSLGGLVAMELALRHPDVYAGVASLSGAFWPNDNALYAELPSLGKQALAVYLDSGGDPSDDSDGAADTIAVRDRMAQLGWQPATSPACTTGSDALCYYWAPAATHDEAAWRARTWRFLRFLFPG
jgi:predicted alpha/beta superfamily hydrolase